jgi:inositol oxygenase
VLVLRECACGVSRSAYPWHDKGEYTELMAPGDEELLYWVKSFNSFDLYT